MQITNLISRDLINFKLNSVSKNDVIEEMAEMVYQSGKVKNKELLIKELKEREDVSSTGIGEEIAIPHVKSDNIVSPAIAIGISDKGIAYQSYDDKPVRIIFLLISNDSAGHLDILSSLSKFLMDNNFVKNIIKAKNYERIIDIINEKEKEQKEINKTDKYEILAVTACPTGIAHTYMAAEQLKNTIKKMGHDCKVETQGAMGLENKITAKDVETADAVILTNDVKIKDKERFAGKPVYEVNSNKIIKKCNELIDTIIKELTV